MPLSVKHRTLAPAPAWAVDSPNELRSLRSACAGGRTRNINSLASSDASSCSFAPLVDPSQADLTPKERWFLGFFRRITAQTNATYFNKAFWGQLVHQASEIQPAVRHAVIGISSLHWSGMMKSNPATDDKIESFSLHQCGKALMYLQDNLVANISRRQRMETVLISCGILLAFAFSQGDARAGGCHLRAGYELLLEWQKFEMDKSPIGAVVLQSFSQIHLDWPPLMDPDDDSKSYSYPLQLAVDYQMEVLIETPEETCGILLILGWLALQMKAQPSMGVDADSAPFAVLKRLQYWKGLILQREHDSSQPRRDTIAILNIWSEVILIKGLADGRLQAGELRYDDFLSHFQRTVLFGKGLLVEGSLPSSWTRSGIVAPLFFCAFKCRDWVTRREALGLLSGWDREQGIWSISSVALVLDRLIQIESKDYQPGETIAESARIDAVRVDFLSGETKVRFWYRRPISSNQESHRDDLRVWDSELIPY